MGRPATLHAEQVCCPSPFLALRTYVLVNRKNFRLIDFRDLGLAGRLASTVFAPVTSALAVKGPACRRIENPDAAPYV